MNYTYVNITWIYKNYKTKVHLRLFQGTLGNSKEIIYWIETLFPSSVIKFQELGTHEHRLTYSSVIILMYITEYNHIIIKSK